MERETRNTGAFTLGPLALRPHYECETVGMWLVSFQGRERSSNAFNVQAIARLARRPLIVLRLSHEI